MRVSGHMAHGRSERGRGAALVDIVLKLGFAADCVRLSVLQPGAPQPQPPER